jgi:glycosyltransferase involved in cell wall biosynthesis
MRVVLSNSSSRWGGVHKVTEILARGLTERGHDVTVFGYPGGMLEERMRGIVPFEPILRGMDLHPVVMVKAAAALRKHRTDVVLAMMKKDVRLTVPAAKAAGIPSVVRHANDRALRGWLYDRVFFGMLPSHHIVNSEATRKTLLESASWIDPRDVTVIHNGIDPSPFETASPIELGVPDGAFTFGFVARLEVRKGLVDLAHAWKIVAGALPEAWLVIAGKGPDEQRARDVLADTPRVRWLGYRADVPQVLASIDVLVVPSHWEGFGLIAAEGLAAGVAVVAARASSLPEIIDDGVEGWLVPPKDPDSLAQALIEAARDGETRSRMAAAGRTRVKSEFSLERMVDGYERVLKQIVGER